MDFPVHIGLDGAHVVGVANHQQLAEAIINRGVAEAVPVQETVFIERGKIAGNAASAGDDGVHGILSAGINADLVGCENTQSFGFWVVGERCGLDHDAPKIPHDVGFGEFRHILRVKSIPLIHIPKAVRNGIRIDVAGDDTFGRGNSDGEILILHVQELKSHFGSGVDDNAAVEDR